MTWPPGLELSFNAHAPIEADFTLWYQRVSLLGSAFSTKVVFGEAKSFGGRRHTSFDGRRSTNLDVFTDDDVSRLKRLAETFPGAVLVFSTMKRGSELTKQEISRLRRLAEWGREYQEDTRRTRAPVIILTGTELFAGYWLSQAWEDLGGMHAEFALSYRELDELGVLADATQQLYLGMDSYDSWREKKWKARRRHRSES